MKDYNVYIDYSEIISIKANSKDEAVVKAIKKYEDNEIIVDLASEAEFKAEEIDEADR